MHSKSKYLVSSIIDTLFPARCAGCSESVARHGGLCATCWKGMHFITEPFCRQCGLPFDYALGDGALCGMCLKETPPYREARALFRYNDASRNAVLALKYADKTQLAPVFGAWLARAATGYQGKARYIVPVPLHWRKLWLRRYNQAALLAQALAQHNSMIALPDALKRTRATPTQSGLTRKGRNDNVRGAFTAHSAYKQRLRGESVLLVDDVMTTGATLAACTRALHDAGVVDVYALTLARTVLED